MRRIIVALGLFVCLLVACDPGSTVDYYLYNQQAKDVTLEIMPDKSCEVIKKDTHIVAGHGKNMTPVLQKGEYACLHYAYRERRVEKHEPFWEIIKSIHIGDSLLPPEAWKDESKWEVEWNTHPISEAVTFRYMIK